MSIKIIAVGGVPASGKTTVFRRRISRLDALEPESRPFALKLLRGREYPARKTVVFGVYDDNRPFAGTDALAMNVQPEAVAFLYHANSSADFKNYRFFFEGDRLFNKSFFGKMNAQLIQQFRFVLCVSEFEQRKRCAARGSNQPAQFLKAQQTKLDNLCENFPPERFVELETEDAVDKFVSELLKI